MTVIQILNALQQKLGLILEKEDEMECLVGGCNFLLKAIRHEAFTYENGALNFVTNTGQYRQTRVCIVSGDWRVNVLKQLCMCTGPVQDLACRVLQILCIAKDVQGIMMWLQAEVWLDQDLNMCLAHQIVGQAPLPCCLSLHLMTLSCVSTCCGSEAHRSITRHLCEASSGIKLTRACRTLHT